MSPTRAPYSAGRSPAGTPSLASTGRGSPFGSPYGRGHQGRGFGRGRGGRGRGGRSGRYNSPPGYRSPAPTQRDYARAAAYFAEAEAMFLGEEPPEQLVEEVPEEPTNEVHWMDDQFGAYDEGQQDYDESYEGYGDY